MKKTTRFLTLALLLMSLLMAGLTQAQTSDEPTHPWGSAETIAQIDAVLVTIYQVPPTETIEGIELSVDPALPTRLEYSVPGGGGHKDFNKPVVYWRQVDRYLVVLTQDEVHTFAIANGTLVDTDYQVISTGFVAFKHAAILNGAWCVLAYMPHTDEAAAGGMLEIVAVNSGAIGRVGDCTGLADYVTEEIIDAAIEINGILTRAAFVTVEEDGGDDGAVTCTDITLTLQSLSEGSFHILSQDTTTCYDFTIGEEDYSVYYSDGTAMWVVSDGTSNWAINDANAPIMSVAFDATTFGIRLR